MARNDKTGEEPQVATGEWGQIQLPLRLACKMARMTADALDSVRQDQIKMHAASEPDPRIPRRLSPYQSRVLSLLGVHFRVRLPAPQEIDNLYIAYQGIHKRLTRLKRTSFRLVTDAVARQQTETVGGDIFGYVLPGNPNTIFLNETFFSLARQPSRQTRPKPNPFIQPRTGAVRGHVEVEEGGERVIYSREFRAGTILHEATHLRFGFGAAGAVHRALRHGTNVDTGNPDCTVGFPQITSYTAAIGDAYVYERFARCVYNARRTNKPGGAANR